MSILIETPCKVTRIIIQFYSSRTRVPKERRKTNRERDDSRLTKLMLLIFLCFLFCFLPLMLVNVFDDKIRFPVLNVLASILAWASSVINPFIYAASNRQYRSAYSKLFNIIKSSVVFPDQFSGNSGKARGTTDKNGFSQNTNKQNSNT